MSRTVLIVSPRFPPLNAADHHRVRMLLPHLVELGWRAIVLAVETEPELGPTEPELLESLPEALEVIRVRPLPLKLTRKIGLGSLGLRSLAALSRKGGEVIREAAPSVAFFSTTEFATWRLGPAWKRQFDLPYVLDWQDPWLTTYYTDTGVPPPGGTFRFGFQQLLARCWEPLVARQAAHHVVVSDAYVDVLRQRYPGIDRSRFSEIPFGVSARDHEIAARRLPETPTPGRYWIYAGRGGPDLAFSLRCLFRAFADARAESPRAFDGLKLWFVGTSYAPKGQEARTVLPLANEMGVGDAVIEDPARIGHFETLRLLQRAEAVLVLGSDDASYNPSKMLQALWAGPPVRGTLHSSSPGHRLTAKAPHCRLAAFGDTSAGSQEAVVHELSALMRAPVAPHSETFDRSRLSEFHCTRLACQISDLLQVAVSTHVRSAAR